jgi:hypothetical protein
VRVLINVEFSVSFILYLTSSISLSTTSIELVKMQMSLFKIVAVVAATAALPSFAMLTDSACNGKKKGDDCHLTYV